jgi:AraC-like DNA-binding protein
MDVLSEIVKLLRTKGQLYGRLEFAGRWGFEFPGGKGICLMVTRGSCFLGVDRQAPLVPLVGGDFVLLAAPESYSLQSHPATPLRPIVELISPEAFRQSQLIAYGENDATSTSLIAGCFTFATPESEWLSRHLPPILHVSGFGAHSPQWFQSTLQIIEAEIVQGLPGSAAVVDRLAEVLFVQAVRTRMLSPSPEESPSWLRALADPQMAEALRRMHTEPGHPWTVTELARAASMSRSAFASRFRELVGTTPLDLLTQWRMVRAAGMIRNGRHLKLAALASIVGYESESAFSKVFRRVIGVSPAQYRRTRSNDAEQEV